MPKSEAEIRASLDAIIEDVERDQRVAGRFAGNLTGLAQATRDVVDVVDRRFGQVDRRFEQVDQRFEQVDQRFEQVDRRFDRLDKEIGLLHDSVRTIDARIEKLVGYIIRDEKKTAGG